MDQYSRLVGIAPKIVRSDDAVAKIREARAAKAAQQERDQRMAAAVEGAKTMSETKVGQGSVLDNFAGAGGA